MKLSRISISLLLLLLGSGLFAQRESRGPTVVRDPGEPLSRVFRPELMDDLAFIRVVSLDLTGRLPSRERTAAFLADTSRDKRFQLIESLMDGDPFIDRWATFLEELFQHSGQLGFRFRNNVDIEFKRMLAEGLGWDQIARRVITTSGGLEDADGQLIQFHLERILGQGFRLDNLDDQINLISSSMLGIQLDCISCHDGAYHLEEVNKGLSVMTRNQFWGMAAFLADTFAYLPDMQNEETTNFYEALLLVDPQTPDVPPGIKFFFGDFDTVEEYVADSEPGQGMRAPRSGGIIPPAYYSTGEGPVAGESRREALARLITADRQFARNMVNRIWAHFFGAGFVEPLDGWDLGRVDAATAQSFDATIQPRTPEIMEAFTDVFIDSGYNFRALFRQITNGSLYQSKQITQEQVNPRWLPDQWRVNKNGRRLAAEAIVDSLNQVRGLPERYMMVGRIDRLFGSTWSFPDATEPVLYAAQINADIFPDASENGLISQYYQSRQEYYQSHDNVLELLQLFGRGSFFEARSNESSVSTSLGMMNDFALLRKLFIDKQGRPLALFEELNQGLIEEAALVNTIFEEVLFRSPTEQEQNRLVDYLNERGKLGVYDIYWVLFNHPDFIHK